MEEQGFISKRTCCGLEDNRKQISEVRRTYIRTKEEAHLINRWRWLSWGDEVKLVSSSKWRVTCIFWVSPWTTEDSCFQFKKVLSEKRWQN